MKNFYIVYVVLFLLIGCKSQNINKIRIKDAPVMVEIVPTEDTIRLSDFFQTCNMLELKGTLLSEINDVKLTEDFIIIQSKAQGKDLHIFDKQGNFIRSLVYYGRAKNEVLNIQAFCYNEYLNTVDALCNYGMEIKRFPINGAICSTIPLPKESIFSARDLEILDATTYVLYKDIGNLDIPEHKLYLLDCEKNKVVDAFIPFDREIEEKISFGQRNNLYRKNGCVYFYEVFQNGIFEVTKDGVNPYIAFTKNSYTLPSDFFQTSRDIRDFIGQCKAHNYVWAHINCYQYKELICSFFTHSSKIYGNIIDLNQKKSHSFLYLNDDLFTYSIIPANMLNIIGSNDENLICNFRYNEHIREDVNYLLFLNNDLTFN